MFGLGHTYLPHGTSATADKWVKGWEEAEQASRGATAE